MKKLIIPTILGLVFIFWISCSKSENISVDKLEKKDYWQINKKSEKECLENCKNIWISNPWNKSETEMNKNCQDICNSWQWITNNDILSCEKISDTNLKNSCYINIAENKKDINICEKVKSKILKNICISKIAKENGDSSLCLKIEEVITRSSCEESIKNGTFFPIGNSYQ